MHRWAMAAALMAGLAAIAAARFAQAAPVSLDGVTFSDELGGFRIVSGSGHGTEQDPFVVVEQITSPDQAVLVIRGAPLPTRRLPRRNRILSGHEIGFALRKVVVNATGVIWTNFSLDLQSTLGQPSPYDDGLSFGQGSQEQTRIRADRFQHTTVISEPLDSVVFTIGDVPPGGRVILDLVITDEVRRPAIYLVQRQRRELSERGGPRAVVLTARRSAGADRRR